MMPGLVPNVRFLPERSKHTTANGIIGAVVDEIRAISQHILEAP